ncbi:MAG: hypothetical protein IKU80_02875 [Firmicutes bacterium]|nr:hypothetical protein [Bacillota bacterium]
MNIHETERKLADLSSKYIYNQTAGSFLLLLLSYIEENMNSHAAAENFEIHEDIKEIKNKINNYISGIENILSDNSLKINALNESFQLKAELLDIYRTIYRYFAQWNIISTVISDEIAIRKYRENENNKDKKIELSLFYTDCIEFLQSAESAAQFKSYMGQLFKCVPFKMAREKYFDLVKRSLKIAFEQESEQSVDIAIETFKNTCAPEGTENYGKYFPEIAKYLEDKKSLKASELSDEALDEEYTDLNTILESLTDIEDYCQEMLNDINSLIIIFYMGYSFDELTENEFGYADIYHKVCEIIESPEESIFDETIKTMLEDYIEPLIDNANEINKKEMELLKAVEDFSAFSEDTSKTLASEGFVRSLFYGNLNEEIFNFNIDSTLPPASAEYKEAKFAEFIDFMKTYFASTPMTVRKSAMQMLLSSLPLAMEVEELMDYVKDGIDNAASFEHSLLIIDKAGTTFMDNGFDYRNEHDEDCDCGHDHHHHHHDCDCGHDHHHHDHNCSCGHDHHHHHHH